MHEHMTHRERHDRRRRILADLRARRNWGDIAMDHQISEATIILIARAHGIPRVQPGKLPTPPSAQVHTAAEATAAVA